VDVSVNDRGDEQEAVIKGRVGKELPNPAENGCEGPEVVGNY